MSLKYPMLQFFLKSKHTDDFYPHMPLSHGYIFRKKVQIRTVTFPRALMQ